MLSPLEMLALPQPRCDLRFDYGPLAAHTGELWLPEGAGPFPLAVLLHGGCWEAAVDRTHLGRFAEALRARGIAAWNLEYRRVGEPGGGWPGTFDDVTAALAALPALARAHPVDLARVALVGHSAGGHLALCYASASPEATKLRAVLALAPLTDLAREGLRGPCARSAGPLVSGARATEEESRDALSPAKMPAPRTPVTLLQGGLDRVVNPSHAERYRAAHGDRCELLALPDAGHFELVLPETEPGALTLATLARCLSA